MRSKQSSSLLDLLKTGDVHIRPILEKSLQLRKHSVDLRIGNEFISTRRTALTAIDPTDYNSKISSLLSQSKIYIPFGKPFVIHPSQHIIACTLEYVSISKRVSGTLYNLSEWSRIGVIIPAVEEVSSTHSGVITFGIANLSNVPVLLYPGMRFCRMVVSTH